MNTYSVTLEYTVVRTVEIITDATLSDVEIVQRAKDADTRISEYMSAPLIATRRMLKQAKCTVSEIVLIVDVFDLATAEAVINRLIVLSAFSPSGQLIAYPKWLTQDVLDRLVSFKLLRRGQINADSPYCGRNTYYRVEE